MAEERACRFPTPKCRRDPVIIKKRRRIATDDERTSTAYFVGTLLRPHRRVVPPPCSASVVYRVLQLMESQETRNKLSRQTDAHRFEATRGSLVGSGRRGNEKGPPPATPTDESAFPTIFLLLGTSYHMFATKPHCLSLSITVPRPR